MKLPQITELDTKDYENLESLEEAILKNHEQGIKQGNVILFIKDDSQWRTGLCEFVTKLEECKLIRCKTSDVYFICSSSQHDVTFLPFIKELAKLYLKYSKCQETPYDKSQFKYDLKNMLQEGKKSEDSKILIDLPLIDWLIFFKYTIMKEKTALAKFIIKCAISPLFIENKTTVEIAEQFYEACTSPLGKAYNLIHFVDPTLVTDNDVIHQRFITTCDQVHKYHIAKKLII